MNSSQPYSQFTLIPPWASHDSCSPSSLHFHLYLRRCTAFPALVRRYSHQKLTQTSFLSAGTTHSGPEDDYIMGVSWGHKLVMSYKYRRVYKVAAPVLILSLSFARLSLSSKVDSSFLLVFLESGAVQDMTIKGVRLAVNSIESAPFIYLFIYIVFIMFGVFSLSFYGHYNMILKIYTVFSYLNIGLSALSNNYGLSVLCFQRILSSRSERQTCKKELKMM